MFSGTINFSARIMRITDFAGLKFSSAATTFVAGICSGFFYILKEAYIDIIKFTTTIRLLYTNTKDRKGINEDYYYDRNFIHSIFIENNAIFQKLF